MSSRRVVTRHYVQRTALKELSRLWRLQAKAKEGDMEAGGELDRLGISPQSSLAVRHEPKRFFKWACVVD